MYLTKQVSRLRPCVEVINKLNSRYAVTANFSKYTTNASRSLSEIPGPSSLPFIGPLLHFLPEIGSIGNKIGYKLSHHLYKTYGPIVRLNGMLGRPAFIFLFDPEASAQILRGENVQPIRPGFQSIEYYRKQYKKPSGTTTPTGLITDHGDNWKSVRSAVNPVLLQPKTVKLYSSVLDQVAQDMITRMKSLRNENNVITAKLDIEINKWSLESIGVVALGGRIGCLDDDLAEDSPASKLIQCVRDIFNIIEELDFKPSVWQYYATKKFKKGMELYEEQLNLSKYFIKRAITDIKKNAKLESRDEKGVLEKLWEIDEHIAVVMANDMLFAGVDTAANTVLGTMYLLATNPEKQKKLREELESNVERRPYLKACLKESMRMLPIVPGNLRRTRKEYNVCGYLLPKNTNVIFNHQYMSMMEKEYPRPLEYLPERWLVEKDDPLHYGQAHPFAMSPFGFGVRQCVGQRIAELEMESFLSQLIKNFNITWFGEPMQIKSSVLNYAAGPYNFVFNNA